MKMVFVLWFSPTCTGVYAFEKIKAKHFRRSTLPRKERVSCFCI